jgi:hypothetical protein
LSFKIERLDIYHGTSTLRETHEYWHRRANQA